jgi:dTMP kinase
MLITFEGLDGSGKTTQASLLVDHLKAIGKHVLFLREPGGTTVSEKIRSILLDRDHLEIAQTTELFLFSAARAQLVREVILPALGAGSVVVCDRYCDSTTAYQGYGRGLPLEEIRGINSLATAGRMPDVTLLVDVDLEELKKRRKGAADRMESSGDEFYRRVRDGYRTLAAREPGRITVVDGMRGAQLIHEEIKSIVTKKLS